MATIEHKPTPAQLDMIAQLKRDSDYAQSALNNAVAIIVAGIAPVGSKLTRLEDGVMYIDVPEVKLTSKDVAVEAAPKA